MSIDFARPHPRFNPLTGGVVQFFLQLWRSPGKIMQCVQLPRAI